MEMSAIILLLGVLFLFVGAWYALSYVFTPYMENPSGSARVTGDCGDTMELAFEVEAGRISRVHTWTDGCSMSRQCIEAAARLLHGKIPSEMTPVTMLAIAEEVGRIPESHLHCALLAELTTEKAARDYLKRRAAREKGTVADLQTEKG